MWGADTVADWMLKMELHHKKENIGKIINSEYILRCPETSMIGTV